MLVRKRCALFVSLLAVSVTMALSTSCVVRRRVITRDGGKSTQILLSADLDSLIKRIADRYRVIQSFTATEDMVPALGTVNKGKVTEYKDVRAYVLFRKPANIRIIGLYPVVRNKAFDMVSDGARFELYIPAKNRLVIGRNDLETHSKNKLANLRPQHFLEAMIVRPVDPVHETAVLENLTDEDNAVYILHILREVGGRPVLARNIWFDRLNLNLVRQQIFDADGNILSDARYADWGVFNGVRFPKRIDINRPQDEYGVVMTVVKAEINKPISDDKFSLERPPDVQVTVLGETGNGSARAGGGMASLSQDDKPDKTLPLNAPQSKKRYW